MMSPRFPRIIDLPTAATGPPGTERALPVARSARGKTGNGAIARSSIDPKSEMSETRTKTTLAIAATDPRNSPYARRAGGVSLPVLQGAHAPRSPAERKFVIARGNPANFLHFSATPFTLKGWDASPPEHRDLAAAKIMLRSLYLATLALIGLLAAAPAARAVTLYANDAESGAGGLNDQTNASYPLIQSSVFGEGANAFHLAHPAAVDEWFSITQSITPQNNSKLFFLSRLGAALAAQRAEVQISASPNFSSPTTIYSQAGSGQPGEGAFSLRQIDLGAYAGQSRYVRFFYDFTGGSYFPQTTPGVGWYVDDVQIGDQYQKIQYSIGDPSAFEQHYLEFINRARAGAITEANRLAAINDPDITAPYSLFGITQANIIGQFTTSVNQGIIDNVAQPLSFNAKLNQAADLHTQDMFNRQFQEHVSSSTPPAPFQPGFTLGDRLTAVGYNFVNAGENVYSYAKGVAHGHAGFDVDWGPETNTNDPNYRAAFANQGMQNPAGHRVTIHNNDFKEIGVGVINGSSGPVGPQLVTQDFGNPGAATFVTGVVYQDANSNNFYDIGEGRSGVRIDVNGSPYYALSTASGGYSVPVSGDGSYNVSFTGGGFATFNSLANITGGLNCKIDYRVTTATSYAADFNNDGLVNGADLAEWRGDFRINGVSDADNDNDSDGADFLTWQRQVGSGAATPTAAAVPEPRGALLAAVGLACAWWARKKVAQNAIVAGRYLATSSA